MGFFDEISEFGSDIVEGTKDVIDFAEPAVHAAAQIPGPHQPYAKAASIAYGIEDLLSGSGGKGGSRRRYDGGGPLDPMAYLNYDFASFLTPQFIDPIEIARRTAEFNASQIDPAAEDALSLTSRFNESNLSNFLSNREAVAPGIGGALEDTISLGQDLTNFRLPQGFVNLLRRESASTSILRGGGASRFNENRYFSTLGMAGLDRALQGATMNANIAAQQGQIAQSLIPDTEALFRTSLGVRTLSPETAIGAEQFNSRLDAQVDSAIAADSRFRANQAFDLAVRREFEGVPPDETIGFDPGDLISTVKDIFDKAVITNAGSEEEELPLPPDAEPAPPVASAPDIEVTTDELPPVIRSDGSPAPVADEPYVRGPVQTTPDLNNRVGTGPVGAPAPTSPGQIVQPSEGGNETIEAVKVAINDKEAVTIDVRPGTVEPAGRPAAISRWVTRQLWDQEETDEFLDGMAIATVNRIAEGGGESAIVSGTIDRDFYGDSFLGPNVKAEGETEDEFQTRLALKNKYLGFLEQRIRSVQDRGRIITNQPVVPSESTGSIRL